jgi:hypothetical protein
MKKIAFLFITILFLIGLGWYCYGFRNQNYAPQVVDYGKQIVNHNENTAVNGEQSVVDQTPEVIDKQKKNEPPSVFDIEVSFVSQAPFALWDPLHNEACEEASMIMAAKYFKGEKLDKEIMEEEIQKLIQWEEKNGYPIDLTAKQAAEILDKYFGLKGEVSNEITAEKIKSEVASGNLIIVPLAGRLVPNPYYRQPGPLYHMLIIRGYDEDEFITNDPGTKRGEAYRYKFDDLLRAVHDWADGARTYEDPRPEPDMEKGSKVMIIIRTEKLVY